MDNKVYVIVGGVAGGSGVAARLRRLDEKAKIIILERGPYVSFANCGLPYYAGGVIQERDNLFVTEESTFTDVLNIDLRTYSEAIEIDRKNKSVKVLNHKNNEEYDLNYDSLVLSPGSKAFIPPIKGIDNEGILTVRNIPDIDKVVSKIENAKRAVVVGGGFVGIEMAENLKEKGLNVSIVEAAPQVMVTLDPDMVAPLHKTLRENGIDLYLNQPIQGFSKEKDKLVVELPSNKIDNVDVVILSIGVIPDTKIAKECGIELGKRGHIVINERFQTNDENIYAVGDAIEYMSPLMGRNIAIALAGPANRQARLAADSIVNGKNRKYPGTYGASILRAFGLDCGSVGLNERTLESIGIEYKVAVTHGSDHAGYYPGALPISVKILYNPKTGELFGGQAVGYRSVDKKIDVLSSYISKKGTVYDLAEFEQSYAPPFNSAKDLLNMLGFIAVNEIDGLDKVIDYREAERLVSEENALVVDVRSKDENALGSIENSILIPHGEIRANLDKLPKDRPIILMCAMGLRGHIALRVLVQNGFDNVYNLTGGYKTWENVRDERKYTECHFSIDSNETRVKECNVMDIKETITVDACGLQCPGPIVKLKQSIDKLNEGEALSIKATDPGFSRDVISWCKMTGNNLIRKETSGGVTTAVISKGSADKKVGMIQNGKEATLIVFSNDFDKALASFVLANGAVASGKKVTMFFTFWGLSLLRKKPNSRVKKDTMGKMFGAMLPNDMDHLKLSNMNFAGMGPKMMKSRMKKKNVDQLRKMFELAKEGGVRFVACQMSMDIMGLTSEELLDGVEIGGVATYMDAASTSNLNLFV